MGPRHVSVSICGPTRIYDPIRHNSFMKNGHIKRHKFDGDLGFFVTAF